MRILITGATGLVGRELGKKLAEKGHEIFVISRNSQKAKEGLPFPCEIISGDLNKSPIADPRLATMDAAINLMGESVVGQRWSESKKESIYNSRVLGTRHLIASLPNTLKVLISSSAIGYYGDRGSEVSIESTDAGSDFLAKVCVDWEKEAQLGSGRRVLIRTGVVVSAQGGALEQILFPFRTGVGGVIGDGQHWMSWIHLDDIVGMFVFALENENIQGVLNGVAPVPVTNRTFSEILAKAVGRRLGPPTPKVALKMIFGEGSEVITSSIRVSSQKGQDLVYVFKHPELEPVLTEICSPFRQGKDIFYAEQFIAAPPEKVFPFFKDAYNLEKITPPSLNFKIEHVSSAEIQQGTLIDYKIRIHGVPVKWKTEIDDWAPPYKFVDNQLKGPYKQWHHTHEFRPFCGGTLMIDRVQFRLPMGYLGWICGIKLVRKDVENIFAFRRHYIANMDISAFG